MGRDGMDCLDDGYLLIRRKKEGRGGFGVLILTFCCIVLIERNTVRVRERRMDFYLSLSLSLETGSRLDGLGGQSCPV